MLKIYLPHTRLCFQNLMKNVFHHNERGTREPIMNKGKENAQDEGEGRSQEDICATGLEKKPIQNEGQWKRTETDIILRDSGKLSKCIYKRQKSSMAGSQRLHLNH